MAGVVGLDWRRFTFAEMRRMYLAKAKHESGLTARIQWAMYAFGGMGGKRNRFQPKDFDPYSQAERKRGVPLTGEAIRNIDLPQGVHKRKPVNE